jgi:hypothetical protein
MLEFRKTPPARLEVRIHGDRTFKLMSTAALLAMLANVGAGVATGQMLYYVLAAVLLVPGVWLRRIYGGTTCYVEKARGKVVLHPGVSGKNEAKREEWPDKEITEARILSRQVFVGKEKVDRFAVGLTRRSLRPTALVQVDDIAEAVEYAVRLSRLLKCEVVDASVQPPQRYTPEEIANLRRRASAVDEAGDTVSRPASIERRRKGSGYEYRWKRQSGRGVAIFGVLGSLLLLGPFYAYQFLYLLWPFVLWLPAAWCFYRALEEWAVIYSLQIEPGGMIFVDGRRANKPLNLRWEQIRGIRRVPGKAGAELVELRAAKPQRIHCQSRAQAAYLEEQLTRAQQRFGPAPDPARKL